MYFQIAALKKAFASRLCRIITDNFPPHDHNRLKPCCFLGLIDPERWPCKIRNSKSGTTEMFFIFSKVLEDTRLREQRSRAKNRTNSF